MKELAVAIHFDAGHYHAHFNDEFNFEFFKDRIFAVHYMIMINQMICTYYHLMEQSIGKML